MIILVIYGDVCGSGAHHEHGGLVHATQARQPRVARQRHLLQRQEESIVPKVSK